MSASPWRRSGWRDVCSRDCPRRAEGCRSSCPDWAEHEKRKAERYRQKKLAQAAWVPDKLEQQAIQAAKKRQR